MLFNHFVLPHFVPLPLSLHFAAVGRHEGYFYYLL